MPTVIIYTLEHPLTGEVRYVGKTKYVNLNKRLVGHLMQAREKGKKNYRLAWLAGLISQNLRPVIKILDIVDESEWEFWERYWISQLKTWGFNLVNGDLGGVGGHRMLPETKAKIIATKRANNSFRKPGQYTHPPEIYARIVETRRLRNSHCRYWKGKVLHPNTRAAQIKAVSGKRTAAQLKTKFDKNLIKAVVMNDFIFFDTVKDAADYMISTMQIIAQPDSVRQCISRVAGGTAYSTQNSYSYYGHTFKYAT